jgi:ornithine carbamoyltransferase
MKHLRKITDLSPADVTEIIKLAALYKEKHDRGVRREDVLTGKVVALVFEKPSLRTKIAFEVAATYLGATPVFLSSSQILASGNMERGRESIPDIGRNLERFADLIIARVYSHRSIDELSASISKPVINALCDCHHPTQALADLLTIRNRFGSCKLKVAFVGDGNNVATSLMQICALEGLDFSIAAPPGYEIPAAECQAARELAGVSGSALHFVSTPAEAVQGASVVYSDTFVSMGQEEDKAKRLKAFRGYQVNMPLLEKAEPNAVFMHCLPAHRGEEVTDEVLDSPRSIVFDQAENRLHIAKALLKKLLT